MIADSLAALASGGELSTCRWEGLFYASDWRQLAPWASVTADIRASLAAARRELEIATCLPDTAIMTRIDLRPTSQAAASFRGFVADVFFSLAAINDEGNHEDLTRGFDGRRHAKWEDLCDTLPHALSDLP